MMRVLLTGASSFTGFWFAKNLSQAGHEVVAPLLRPLEEYQGDIRADRVKRLAGFAQIVPECRFGSEGFMRLLKGPFDLFAHHAAQVGDYRGSDFDITGAVASNTYNLHATLRTGNVGAVLLTSSVFAQGEGVGTLPLKAFSPYGLSKGLTTDLVTHIAVDAGIPLGRFVIQNPFGPLEEPRFCAYLMRTWKAGETARVNTPAYVRDNIHVDLLARAYLRYAAEVASGTAAVALHPSGYISTQGDFAMRFAREMRERMGLDCGLDLPRQTEFSEPVMRVNTEPAALYVTDWDEKVAWDSVAEAYQ